MRLGAFIAVLTLISPAALDAQEYSARSTRPPGQVLRPAETVAWRNYVTVPDGPCGCAMSVQADCYNDCPHRCNPVRFIRRVGRMLDCLLPCNLCCADGLHGCHLGCGVCCGSACGGGCGASTCGHRGGCPNPAGSVFDNVAPSCTCGGHCVGCGTTVGCSTTVPMLSDPFLDDPLPPKPTTQPATEVRRAAPQQTRQAAIRQGTGDRSQGSGVRQAAVGKPMNTRSVVRNQEPVARSQGTGVSQAVQASPYKIVNAPVAKPNVSRSTNKPSAPSVAPAANVDRGSSTQSVLRRASAEEDEPQPLDVDHAKAVPLSRAQLRSMTNRSDVPSNPLR